MSAGDDGKDIGMQHAMDAVPEWRQMAEAFIRDLRPGTRITSEDLTAVVGLPRGGTAQNRNSAVGAVINASVRRGMLAPTGVYVKSRIPSSHSAILQVWEVV